LSIQLQVSVHEAAPLRICSSCKRPIPPTEKAVSFKCPSCGAVVMWRCYRCRSAAVIYKCPNCGFEGP
jgi:LSD1 subclass zinc finger protein